MADKKPDMQLMKRPFSQSKVDIATSDRDTTFIIDKGDDLPLWGDKNDTKETAIVIDEGNFQKQDALESKVEEETERCFVDVQLESIVHLKSLLKSNCDQGLCFSLTIFLLLLTTILGFRFKASGSFFFGNEVNGFKIFDGVDQKGNSFRLTPGIYYNISTNRELLNAMITAKSVSIWK